MKKNGSTSPGKCELYGSITDRRHYLASAPSTKEDRATKTPYTRQRPKAIVQNSRPAECGCLPCALTPEGVLVPRHLDEVAEGGGSEWTCLFTRTCSTNAPADLCAGGMVPRAFACMRCAGVPLRIVFSARGERPSGCRSNQPHKQKVFHPARGER
ncbi:hypothetical protein NDU88_006418 [Pleurodeles waltl]|uniref:Uncharacterized protein n=1 Tax=Pleurodeles waltl TaxID=8319 RepID=A0AAV7LWV2_PLEWA|nr:hypothetical protein NDU88_006418 [Pleurodeles waltl]